MIYFWKALNEAISEDNRILFNKWRLEMYALSENMVSATNGLPDDERYRHLCNKARELHGAVRAIPVLIK